MSNSGEQLVDKLTCLTCHLASESGFEYQLHSEKKLGGETSNKSMK